MRTLTGRDLAAAIRTQTQAEAASGPQPRLAVVVATADEASLWYVRSIAKAAAAVGIDCDLVDLG
ncbi:tetrahydrofolate dehydrogenase/cyclohydrolase catalytic domain-containing protein, partial [Nonomuraea fuscirosea]